MTRKRRILLVAILLFLTYAHVDAQGLPSGSIGGSVTAAADGSSLPGVTVTARSPALQGVRQSVSANNGGFLLSNLPPGEYTVEFQLTGFQTRTLTGVHVGTAQREELQVAIGLESVSEKVVVTASQELVSTSPQSSTTMTGELLGQLPVPRTFESAALLSPDVYGRPASALQSSAPNAFSIAGAETYENAITIDGVSPQENVFRMAEPLYVEDAVAEVSTLTSGISAEYGYFAGGTIHVITRTGGNSVSASLRSTLINDAWTAPTPFGEKRVSDLTPFWEATFGGPVMRDRLWLFTAGRLFDQTTTSMTAAPTNISFPTDSRETRYNVKLTASPFSSQTLTLAASGLDRERNDIFAAEIPVLDLASLFDEQFDEHMVVANYTGAVSNNLFVEAHYGQRRRSVVGGSTNTDLVMGTPLLTPDWRIYHAPGFCAVCPNAKEHRDSDQGLLKTTWFLPTASLGSHTVAAGIETYKGSFFNNNYQSGTSMAVFGSDVIAEGGDVYPVFGPGTTLWVMPIQVPAAPNDIRTYSAYVNDTWDLSNRLTMNLGMRWDKNRARDPEGNPISDTASFSPRISAAWDPSGSGKLRITASYGRYVSLLSEGQIFWSSPYGLQTMVVYNYDGPSINTVPGQPLVSGSDALRQLFDWFGITQPGQFPPGEFQPVWAFLPGVNIAIRQGLEPQRADELTLGLNGSIGSRGSYRVEAAERKYSRFYDLKVDMTTGSVTDSFGNVYDMGIVSNLDSPYERRHRALKSTAQVRVSSAFVAGASWTWSRTWGNHVSESLGSGPNPSDTLGYPEYWQRDWHIPVGDLPQDVRHRIRLWTTWDVPSLPHSLGSVNLGALFALDTGQPYGAAGNVLVGSYVTNPGYATPPDATRYWFTNRDAYRTPTVTHLDLSLNWSRNFGHFVGFVQPQVINVFNNDDIATNEYLDTAVATAVNDATLQPFDPFHEKPVEGVNWAKSPTFGQAIVPEAYQQPRTYQISMGMRF